MRRVFLQGVIFLSFFVFTVEQAFAQTRFVVVNGQRLSDAQIMDVEATYGIAVADGAYWFHEPTGAWGSAGNPAVQGILRPNYGSGASVGGPGYNRNTAGGGIMSDGNCAFVLGIPAGNC